MRDAESLTTHNHDNNIQASAYFDELLRANSMYQNSAISLLNQTGGKAGAGGALSKDCGKMKYVYVYLYTI